jgi:hypothetical protein
LTWFVGVLSFLLGLLACLVALRWRQVHFSYKLGLSDILNWVMILAAAKWFEFHWQRRHAAARIEKDLLIVRAHDSVAALKSARDAFMSSYNRGRITKDDDRGIKGCLRELSNSIYFLDRALGYCEIQLDEMPKLKKTYRTYKAALTGGNYPAKPFSAENWTKQELVYRLFQDTLQALTFRINKI